MNHEYMQFQPERSQVPEVKKQFFQEFLRRLLLLTRVIFPFRSSTTPEEHSQKKVAVLLSPINSFRFFQKPLKAYFENMGFQPIEYRSQGLFASHESEAKKLEEFLLENKIKDCIIVGVGSSSFLPLLMEYKGRDRVAELMMIFPPMQGIKWHRWFPMFRGLYQTRPRSAFLDNIMEQAQRFPRVHCIFSKYAEARLGRHDDIQLPELGSYRIAASPVLIECLDHIFDSG